MKIFFTLSIICASLSQSLFSKQPSECALQILQERIPTTNVRHKTFAEALTLMQNRKVKTIVETGTARGLIIKDMFIGDGGSTILFADWANRNKAQFFSVDINPNAFNNTAHLLVPYKSNLTLCCQDSVKFLKNFNGKIDMLYLDSYDFEVDNPQPSQEHHLKEIIAAYPKLTKNSIVMIDDCDLPYGGKGTLVIDYLKKKRLENNYARLPSHSNKEIVSL